MQVSSVKHDAKTARAKRHFDGQIIDGPYGVCFSSGALWLNVSDGKRNYHVMFDKAETEKLRQRFAETSVNCTPENP